MQNKFLKIFIVVVLALIFVFSIYFVVVNKGNQNSNPAHVSGNQVPIPTSGGNVDVADFYKTANRQIGDTVVAAETPDYQISYYKKDNSFSIVLLGSDSRVSRDEAESKLLEILNISFSEACKLTINEFVPYSVSAELSGKNYGFSYCPGSGTF